MSAELPMPYLLTVPQVCYLLGYKKSKVYQMIKENRLPTIRDGRYVRVHRQELERWVNEELEKNKKTLVS